MKITVTRIASMFPTALPVGGEQFNAWAQSIFRTFNLEDKPANRHALASLIMHLGPTTNRKPKAYFAKAVLKSLANETAFETIQLLKKDEDAYMKKWMGDTSVEAEASTEQGIA